MPGGAAGGEGRKLDEITPGNEKFGMLFGFLLLYGRSNMDMQAFIWLVFPAHNPSLREVRAGTQKKKNVKQKPWKSTTCWLMFS